MTYRTANESEYTQIANVFFQAFKGYPLFENMIDKKHPDRDRFLYAIHELNTRTYARHHLCLVGEMEGEIVAAALISRPDGPNIGVMKYLKMGGAKLLLRYPRETMSMLFIAEETAKMCHKLKGDIWFIEEFAVLPERQHQHLGSRMMDECVKPYIAQHGGGILALNTNIEINRDFYRKNGLDEFYAARIRRRNWEIGNWCFKMEIPAENTKP